MISSIIGGVVGGTFNAICQLSFISGAILAIAIFLVWRCFNGECWFGNCNARKETPEECPQEHKVKEAPSKKSRDLYAKIEEIVQKNLGMSAQDLIFANSR